MYFTKRVRTEVLLEPKYFGARMFEHVRRTLINQVEGTCDSNMCYIVAMQELKDEDIERGVIEYETGFASFMVTYTALVYRCFTNEVVDAQVVVVNQTGFHAKAGPLKIFVSRHQLPNDMRDNYQPEHETFVSNEEEGEPIEIRVGCVVRLRLIRGQMKQNEITAVGQIRDDFLGVIEL